LSIKDHRGFTIENRKNLQVRQAPRHIRGVVVIIFVLAALVLSGAAWYNARSRGSAGPYAVLILSNSDSGKIYGRWPLAEAEEFAIEFIHSVNQSTVRETFKIDGSMIYPCEVRFFSFGAGMQSDLEQGQTMSRDKDALVISGNYAPHTELNYIVGTVSDHSLLIKDQVISLRELCGRNAHISLRIK
jgi:hypothetical protein